MASKPQPLPLSPDRALDDPAEDRLGYAPFAKQLARSILHGCPADGLVVALYGAWGTGKSTALNFVIHYVMQDDEADPAIVVRFNPWWFAGHEDLTRRFFRQFESALFKAKARKRSMLRKLSAFSSVVSELPIPYVGSAAKAAKAALAAAQAPDVVELKAALVAELARDATRIIVVIDDIDRLAADEIRQLFQVVKAVADFPNVIYLLAFDREVVVKALERSHAFDGEEYLEKIVQVPFTLPPADRSQLQSLLFERLDQLIEGTPDELFDQQYWGNVYLDGIDPFIRKPRDVVRLVNALNVTYAAARGEVNAVDFIAVEVLRIFVPAAYEVIRTNPEFFTGGSDRPSQGQRDSERRFHEAWLGELGNDRPVVRRLIVRLFPRLDSVWGNTVHGNASIVEWRKRLRVCSPEVFPVFFRLAVPEGEVSAAIVRRIIADADNSKAFGECLLSLARDRRADGHTRATSLLTRLSDHAEKDIPTAAVASVLKALFEVGDDVVRAGKRTTGIELGDEWRIGWLVQVLLRRLPKEERSSVMQAIVETAGGLVTMTRELADIGGQHGRWGGEAVVESEQLLRSEDLDGLERKLLSRIRAAGIDGSLWKAVQPRLLLEAWAMWGDSNEMRDAVAARLQDDDALLDFVALFVTRVRSHGFTDRVARSSIRIDPQRLAEFVDVDSVASRIDALRKRRDVKADARTIIEAFVGGRMARAAGKDPRWSGDFDDV